MAYFQPKRRTSGLASTFSVGVTSQVVPMSPRRESNVAKARTCTRCAIRNPRIAPSLSNWTTEGASYDARPATPSGDESQKPQSGCRCTGEDENENWVL